MALNLHIGDDPFLDPTASDREELAAELNFVADSTLSVGRNASLTLGTDSLIVLGKSIPVS